MIWVKPFRVVGGWESLSRSAPSVGNDPRRPSYDPLEEEKPEGRGDKIEDQVSPGHGHLRGGNQPDHAVRKRREDGEEHDDADEVEAVFAPGARRAS